MFKFCLRLNLVICIFILLFCTALATSLEAPMPLYPTFSDSPLYAGEIELKWTDTGANFYKYHINLPEGQSKEDIVKKNSFPKLYDLTAIEEFTYTWAVAACADNEGINCSPWSNTAGFQITFAKKELLGGIVPCGRKYNNPATKYNEAEPCEFKHIFLLIKNVLDFALWRLGLIILVLLTLAVGVIYYFSMGTSQTMVRVKSILKSAGVGYGIIFLGWLIVNWILVILGFQIEFFGKWWLW